ncbi:Uma2 family endonuclease [Planctomicrobium piriforme]|uniref:Endonuclease, Uma2 family (Restriction endonuclease fold) n=1 Tax=Planctomicrobium piriforme TaxID=1576369 RepID=A0A1I3J9W6_9PLAN|nr:Uma2 family endonuclease [Planctomicrobium piriforme]SFI56685.1 Endonuclease, Uma2 family (restriction endonuclease fold) [Planctomicrobium piriforme]
MTQAALLRRPEMTVDELAARIGPVPLWRVRTDPAPGTATEDDVERLRREEGVLCELIDGVLVEKASNSKKAFLNAQISTLLGNFVQAGRLGWVLGPNGFVWLLGRRLRAPDVSFYRLNQLPNQCLPDTGFLDVAPALAIEVLSPGNTAGEMERKRRDFFAAGTEQFWIVDPEQLHIQVFTGPDACRTYSQQEPLDAGSVLPGFQLNIAELFAAPTVRGK